MLKSLRKLYLSDKKYVEYLIKQVINGTNGTNNFKEEIIDYFGNGPDSNPNDVRLPIIVEIEFDYDPRSIIVDIVDTFNCCNPYKIDNYKICRYHRRGYPFLDPHRFIYRIIIEFTKYTDIHKGKDFKHYEGNNDGTSLMYYGKY